ncbi:MAG TPA: hypothetical protein VFG87_05890 [Amycolatopsis sp.]|nr:hypothetical protein [Amycolatopsis sp.]
MSTDNNFWVNTEGLSTALSAVKNAGDAARNAGQLLADTLNQYDGCWGNDPTGQEFFRSFGGASQQLQQGLSDTADVVNGTADGVKTMATNLTTTEDNNIGRVQELTTPDMTPADPTLGKTTKK